MRLKQLLLISLITLQFFSCGGSKDPIDPAAEYKVSEEEFYFAISLENIKYFQINASFIEYIVSPTITETSTIKSTPNAAMNIHKFGSEYQEDRFFRDQETLSKNKYVYKGYSRDLETGEKWKRIDDIGTILQQYRSIKQFGLSALTQLIVMGGDYSSFSFKDNLYSAHFAYMDYYYEDLRIEDWCIGFKDKKITYFKLIRYNPKKPQEMLAIGEANVTYEKEDIIEPFVPLTSKIAII